MLVQFIYVALPISSAIIIFYTVSERHSSQKVLKIDEISKFEENDDVSSYTPLELCEHCKINSIEEEPSGEGVSIRHVTACNR